MTDLALVNCVVAGDILVKGLAPKPLERLRQRLQLPNPEYRRARRMSAATAVPEFLDVLFEEPDGDARVPRGAVALLKESLGKDGLKPHYFDERARGAELLIDQAALGRATAAKPPRFYQTTGAELAESKLQGLIVIPCVAGDTEIQLNRGGKGFRTTLEHAYQATRPHEHTKASQAVGLWDPSIPTFIRSKVGDRIRLARVEAFLFKGVRETIELEFSIGAKLRVTPEHEILTPTGFVPASKLKPGSKVIFDGERELHEWKEKARYRRLSWYESHPFARVERNPRSKGGRQAMLEEHRAVAEAQANGLSIEEFRERCRSGNVDGLSFLDPKLFHVHHVDENTRNNSPENLEVMRVPEHLSHHTKGYENFCKGVPTECEVVAVGKGRLEKVYDVACAGFHNFCAGKVVVHNCGGGKTTLGALIVARLLRTTIVLVHTEDLLDQWVGTIRTWLGIEPGTVRDGKITPGPVVVAMVQTLAKYLDTPEGEAFARTFGVVLVDEAHHAPGPATFQKCLRKLPALVRIGLTATPDREDELTALMDWSFGPRLLTVDVQTLIRRGWLMPPAIEMVETDFRFTYELPAVRSPIDEHKRLAKLGKALVNDKNRNDLIANLVTREWQSGETVLVLSNHKAHCRALGRLCVERGADARVLVSESTKSGKAKRKETIEAMRTGAVRLVIATSLADEGLDIAPLSRVVLALPERARGRTTQRIGRLMRVCEGKSPKLFDVVDPHVDTLVNRANERRRTYKSLGLLP